MDNRRLSFYMDIVRAASLHSHANRRKVGSLGVCLSQHGALHDKILGLAINGTPPGHPNACEDENGTTLPTVIHAEIAMITKMHPMEREICNAVFVTKEPCRSCAIRIADRLPNLQWLVYAESSRSQPRDGLKFLPPRIRVIQHVG